MSFVDFVAGCWGGACGVLVGHPLDTIKVRLQTTSDVNVKFSNLLFNKNQKLGGLFNGLSSPLACLAFVNAIVFGVYGNLNEFLKNQAKGQPETGYSKIRREFIAGTISGVAQCLITCPMELVKCRMQIVPSAVVAAVASSGTMTSPTSSLSSSYFPFRSAGTRFTPTTRTITTPSTSAGTVSSNVSSSLSMMETIKAIKQSERSLLRGLYRGMVPTLLRDAPAFGIYFSSFQYLIDRKPNPTEGWLLMAGGVAGTLSWIFIYPVDVIKTKIQTHGDRYNYSMVQCTRSMLRESNSGLKVFFRGFVPTLLRAFPVNAVTFYVVNKTFVIYENYLSPTCPSSSSSPSSSPLTGSSSVELPDD